MTAPAIIKTFSSFALGGVVALFSPTDVKEIIIAVGVFVAGVGVVVVNVINARAQSRKLDAQGAKIDVIEGHVNSEKTEAQGKIASLQQEVSLLREIVADKKETAALLAQAVATQPLVALLPVAPPVPAPEATVQDFKEKK